MKTLRCVGLDVHKDSIAIAVAEPEGGEPGQRADPRGAAGQPARPRAGLVSEERFDELVRVELLQVGDLLAYPDVAHRDLQGVANPDDHAALRRAVELGEHEPGHAQRLVELARLLAGVLARW